MAQPRKKISDYASAREAMADLCRPFIGRAKPPACTEVQPARMSPIARRLLAHREHMTVVLGEHYSRPMDVRILKKVHQGERYTRKILLVPRNSDRIVEAGIMRLSFAYTPAAVRDEILEGRRPLGEILTAHDVLRRIEPLWFVRFGRGGGLDDFFSMDFGQPIYGRLAMIYCNGEPAVELLETVIAG